MINSIFKDQFLHNEIRQLVIDFCEKYDVICMDYSIKPMQCLPEIFIYPEVPYFIPYEKMRTCIGYYPVHKTLLCTSVYMCRIHKDVKLVLSINLFSHIPTQEQHKYVIR